ncbi:hypothetical protein CDD82_5333 [Ophiocordyceps australis]|uniref:Cytochrome c oxidase assembly protein COX20, mitochondrial n=1 Tax=Ophiocordyceps australis TaxID=1399860 RepID=A0A2C5YVS5_9HYPO|nr:hypothetical protein CDD82_5333 [Ophiocordyceps australis]
MASDTKDNSKTLHAWSKPSDTGPEGQAQSASGSQHARPSLSEAIGTIHAQDFANIPNLPCARNGLLVGIASGFLSGSLYFVTRGKVAKATNWAVGMFLVGSTASYEYCHYQRRAERTRMKRHIEIVAEKRREVARQAAEEEREKKRLEQEHKAVQKPWYKVW